jgi:Haem-NO-binding
MYGIINKVLQEMVISRHGIGIWEAAKARAQVEIDIFLSNDIYSDEITHNLVDAVSFITSCPPAEIYCGIGEWYVVHVVGKQHDGMLKAGGKTLKDFIINLPILHASMKRLYACEKPTEFTISDVQENSVLVGYRCPDAGLKEMVRGFLSGLCKLFAVDSNIILIEINNTHTTYKVCW